MTSSMPQQQQQKQPSSFTFNRYADVFASASGPGDARPTARQIVADEGLDRELEGGDGKALPLADKSMLITGASGGLGLETAEALAATGARLLLGVRSLDRGRAAVERIEAAVPGAGARCELVPMDLEDLASVRSAAEGIAARTDRLNMLIFNAGIGAPPLGYTKDGYERQFQINHLSHFLLFQVLKPLLLKAAAPDFASRVVVVSSITHRFGTFDLDHFNYKSKPYEPGPSYGASKTACQWTSNEIERRYGSRGIHSMSLHPGGTFGTDFGKGQDAGFTAMVVDTVKNYPQLANIMMSPGQCAATQVLAAISRDFEGQGGLYLEDCGTSKPIEPDAGLIDPGYAPWAFDEVSEKKLWSESCKLLSIDED